MFTVYALYSPAFDKIYVGFTSNMEQRFLSHNELGKGWTARFRPWIVIHKEAFDSKKAAMEREKQLKTAAGRMFIRSLIKAM